MMKVGRINGFTRNLTQKHDSNIQMRKSFKKICWLDGFKIIFFINVFIIFTLYCNSVSGRDCKGIELLAILRGGSRTAATSKMERFVIIANGWKPLIITKRPILDVAAVLDLPLILLNGKLFWDHLRLLIPWDAVFWYSNKVIFKITHRLT